MNRTSEFRRHHDYLKKCRVKYLMKNILLEAELSNDSKFIGKMSKAFHSIKNHHLKNQYNGSKKDKLTKQEKIANEELKNFLSNQ